MYFAINIAFYFTCDRYPEGLGAERGRGGICFVPASVGGTFAFICHPGSTPPSLEAEREGAGVDIQ